MSGSLLSRAANQGCRPNVCGRGIPVPLHSSPEAVFKTDGRNIFQALLSKADVRQRMPDIAGTSRRVMGRAVKSNDLLQHLVRSVQGMADSCGNVEHLA